MFEFDRRRLLTGAGLACGLAAVRLTHARPADDAYGNALESVDALRGRKVSSVELVDAAIKRIERFDPKLNAICVRSFELARAAARDADAALARGDRRPLLGIPVTIKESFDVAGLPTTWGLPRGKDWMAKDDALAVARLRGAGAVVLGKTNVSLMLGDWQSYNEVYGTTNNPWNPALTPGGSSGGSAAALAAGFGHLSIGSDIGGSLRVPAHFCGVFAHKPTLNLVPTRGHIPPGLPPLASESDLAVAGPMARTAADLALGLDVLAGPDEWSTGVGYKLALPPPRHQRLSDFRILAVDAHPLVPTARAVSGAVARFAERLVKAGVKVERSSPLLPSLDDATRLYLRLLLAGTGAFWPPELYGRIRTIAAGMPAEDRSLVAERVRGAAISYRDWAAADVARRRLRDQWRQFFKEFDLVVCPPFTSVAFAHDHSMPQEERRLVIDGQRQNYIDAGLVWAGLATAPGLPATAMPVELSEDGLPVGVQVIGPYLEDRTPLTFAALAEREFGGFVAPPGYGDT
jgi:amidase